MALMNVQMTLISAQMTLANVHMTLISAQMTLANVHMTLISAQINDLSERAYGINECANENQ
jgi:hypothetical protein